MKKFAKLFLCGIICLSLALCCSCRYIFSELLAQEQEEEKDDELTREKIEKIVESQRINDEIRKEMEEKGLIKNGFMTADAFKEKTEPEEESTVEAQAKDEVSKAEKSEKNESSTKVKKDTTNKTNESENKEQKPQESAKKDAQSTAPKCDYCKGSGKYCSFCSATGVCKYCSGTTLADCYVCKGSGLCDYCKGAAIVGAYGRDCPDCTGGDCKYCDGGKKTCKRCKGKGICSICGGEAVCGACGGKGTKGGSNYTGEEGITPLPVISDCEKCMGIGYLDCPSCATGKCIECGGDGEIKIYTGASTGVKISDCKHCIDGTCTRCHGAREIDCSAC